MAQDWVTSLKVPSLTNIAAVAEALPLPGGGEAPAADRAPAPAEGAAGARVPRVASLDFIRWGVCPGDFSKAGWCLCEPVQAA